MTITEPMTTRGTTPGKSGPAGPPTKTLPEDHIKAVEAGILYHHRVIAERDDLKKELVEAKDTITRQRVEVEALQSLHNLLESRITSCLLERDQAVADRAIYEVLFVAIQAQMRVFSIPASPLIKEMTQQDEQSQT